MGARVNLNDILIPHLKKAFRLSDFRSSLIQSAFFGGYFLADLPAGRLMERIGYRKGILLGLFTSVSLNNRGALPLLQAVENELDARRYAQLVKYVKEIVPYRVFAQTQLNGNVFVPEPFGNKSCDIGLTLG